MSTLQRHAERMQQGPPSLDREVARDYLLGKSDSFRALVIYDLPAQGIMVYEIQPDGDTLAKLMSCHNKYVGVNAMPEEFKAFVRNFPAKFDRFKIIDNTDPDSKWRGMMYPISFVFLLGDFDGTIDAGRSDAGTPPEVPELRGEEREAP